MSTSNNGTTPDAIQVLFNEFDLSNDAKWNAWHKARQGLWDLVKMYPPISPLFEISTISNDFMKRALYISLTPRADWIPASWSDPFLGLGLMTQKRFLQAQNELLVDQSLFKSLNKEFLQYILRLIKVFKENISDNLEIEAKNVFSANTNNLLVQLLPSLSEVNQSQIIKLFVVSYDYKKSFGENLVAKSIYDFLNSSEIDPEWKLQLMSKIRDEIRESSIKLKAKDIKWGWKYSPNILAFYYQYLCEGLGQSGGYLLWGEIETDLLYLFAFAKRLLQATDMFTVFNTVAIDVNAKVLEFSLDVCSRKNIEKMDYVELMQLKQALELFSKKFSEVHWFSKELERAKLLLAKVMDRLVIEREEISLQKKQALNLSRRYEQFLIAEKLALQSIAE